MNTSSVSAKPPKKIKNALSKVKRVFFVSYNLVLAFVLLAAGVLLLHARASAEVVDLTDKITVQTVTVEKANGYEVEHQFVGLIESVQEIDVAFETGGTVASVPITEGEVVKKGSVLAIVDQRSIKAQQQQIIAARKEAIVSLQRADLALQRQLNLESSGYGSKQDYDDTRLDVEQKSSSLVGVDAQLRSMDIALAKSVLVAPFDAVVGERLVDAGDVVSIGQPILRLFRKDNLTARIGIPANMPIDWEAQSTNKLTVNGQEFQGRYLGKRPDVSAGTRVIETRFQLLGETENWPAMGQMAQLHWYETREAAGYWVPISALTEGKRGLWSIFRLVDDEEANNGRPESDVAIVVREHVEIIHTDGDRVYVQGALPETFQIVYNGSHRVVPQQRVLVAQNTK